MIHQEVHHHGQIESGRVIEILVNDNRLAKGREILAKYKAQFDATEKAYGVDRYVIAAMA